MARRGRNTQGLIAVVLSDPGVAASRTELSHEVQRCPGLALPRSVRVTSRRNTPPADQPPTGQWFFHTVRIRTRSGDGATSAGTGLSPTPGQVQEVRGLGVVGKQPVLAPGETFEYTSGCPLTTPFGSMRGSYQMMSDRQETFDVEIAPFTLTEPYATVH